MKIHLTAILLSVIMLIFIFFVKINSRYSTVFNIISPTKLEIISNSGKAKNTDIICVNNVEAFSLEPSEKFYRKYSKKYNLSRKDMVSLGFLAQDYSQKLLQNKSITVKYSPIITKECRYAKVKLSGMNYSKLLANSGYGLEKGKITNEDKFKTNLENARKLDLVILNHNSGKYHTLDCPYGLAAHDSVIIPAKQLPKEAVPCKYCHNIQNEKSAFKLKKEVDIFNIVQIPQPKLELTDGSVKFLITDYTKKLKPDNNCSTTVCKALVDFIDRTNSTLDIAAYGYENNSTITSALNRAKARGVDIRYVYDEQSQPENNHYKDNQIITNISTSSKSDRYNSANLSNMIMHNKFLISDKQKVFTGSMNISRSGLSGFDVNNVVIINSEEIANLYTKEFEQMLSGKFHGLKAQVAGNNAFVIGNSEIEIYFSPKDKPVQRITELINNSETYVYLPTFLITHRNISNALISAKKRGVDVRIIVDANGAITSHTKLKELRDAGILLKTENFAGKLHAKSIIIDDEYIVTGSMNFSYSGSDKNDENTLVIKNNNFAKMYKDFFLYLWTIIPNKYLNYNANPESPDSLGSCSDGVDNNFNGKIDKEESACK